MLAIIKQRRPILVLALLFTVCALVTNLATDIEAQSSGQERANALRGQLVDIQTKRESLEIRLKHLDEELRPENIEKSLAGIGSTHPEDLRELWRRQLEIEKTNIQAQLKLLAESQTRLEAGIIQADAHAYHQSALVNHENPQHSSPSASSKQLRARRIGNKPNRRRIYRLTQD